MRWFLPGSAVLSIFLNFAPAFAHARLRESSPAVESAGTAPQDVSITFSEALEPKLSTITVTDAAQGRVDQGELHVVQGNARVVAIGLKPLVPGVYTVKWHATSVDTHTTDGTFSFTVVK